MQSRSCLVLLALLGLAATEVAGGAALSGEELEKLHEIVAPDEPVDPFVKLLVDGKAIEATYYDPSVRAEQYSEKRRQFDRKLIDAIASFTLDFVDDTLLKKRYLVTIGPKYMARATSMIASYLPEYFRLVSESAAQGMPVKHGFIGDSTAIWRNIQAALADPEKHEQVKRALPKSSEQFMERVEDLMQTSQIMIRKSPVGIYLDNSSITFDGKTIEQLAAPLVLYLQEKGYGKHLAVLDSIVRLVSSIKPGSQAYQANQQ